MLLVCVSALGFILVLLLLDKASDLVNHIGHHLYHPVHGGAGRRRYGHQAHRVPLDNQEGHRGQVHSRAAAAAETIHAHTHLKNAGKIGDTAANLQDAIGGETYEFTKMYPEMIKEAEAEGQTAVAKYMDMVNKVEEVHANLYKKAAADNHAFDNVDFYVCKVCGYTHEGPCDSCPVCGAKAAAFFKVDDACCLNK